MFLFTVQQTFEISGRGLVLTPGLGDHIVGVGSKIKLIRPDQSIVETKICGITFEGTHDILVGNEIRKADVPVGTEVWLSA